MRITSGDGWRNVRQGWIAFCSGWWLAGIVFGFRHFTELWTQPSTILELIGTPLIAGGFLPGASPIFSAAEIRGITGLPIGFTGTFIGSMIGLSIWFTLPIAIYRDSRQVNLEITPKFLSIAVIPYLAAGAGLVYLYEANRAQGWKKLHATGISLGTTIITYLVGATILFLFGLLYLTV